MNTNGKFSRMPSKNVKSEKCLIDRLIILCLDEATALKCKYDGFTHCVQYVDTLGASDFMQNEYWRIVWLKSKMALALVSAEIGRLSFTIQMFCS